MIYYNKRNNIIPNSTVKTKQIIRLRAFIKIKYLKKKELEHETDI